MAAYFPSTPGPLGTSRERTPELGRPDSSPRRRRSSVKNRLSFGALLPRPVNGRLMGRPAKRLPY